MEYKIDDIEKVLDENLSDTHKIDVLLEMDAKIYCNLGSDSNKTELELAKKNSRKLYTLIKKIDFDMGDSFLKLMDKKK
jgi:hypothetical protein